MRIAREARPFLVVCGAAAVATLFVKPWLAVVPLAALVFVANFFRDPDRQAPPGTNRLLCPADGRVVAAESGRVSIFMNVFDVHVCRAPAGGVLTRVTHVPGRFLAAFKDGASEHNERVRYEVAGDGTPVQFTLVAGLVARRIVPWVRAGDHLVAGQRVGIIRFGSRVDVDLPPGAVATVSVGDRVRAGETAIARLAAAGTRTTAPTAAVTTA